MSFYLVAAFLALGDASVASQPAAAKPDAEDRIICTMHVATGTRFGKKLCMKASEREAMRRNAQEEARLLADARQVQPLEAPGSGK